MTHTSVITYTPFGPLYKNNLTFLIRYIMMYYRQDTSITQRI